MRFWNCLVVAVAVNLSVLADEAKTDFRSFHLNGSAKIVGGVLRLTPAVLNQAGAAWLPEKRYIAGGFELTFRFQITDRGGLGEGADGIAFVIQDAGPDALAGSGSAGGFALGGAEGDKRRKGIPHSVAVFFDTFLNPDGHDPSDNYVAICTNGSLKKMRWPPARLGATPSLPVFLKDGQVHSARILFQPPLLSVFLDDGDKPLLRVPIDVSTVINASGYAYLGFTASTGSGFENHDVLDWSFESVSSSLSMVESNIVYHRAHCLEGRNLCTPAEATVEDRGNGSYHVVVPAHLEWTAAIPNPKGRAVAISNAHGSVCSGTKDVVASCVNPADGLVSRTERGRTSFSVKSVAGRSPQSNEGFFEFDVSLQ